MVMRWFRKRDKTDTEGKAAPKLAGVAAADTRAAVDLDDPALRDDPVVQRKRIAAAPDAESALAMINELSAAKSERIPLYLARRDLADALWQDPELTDEAALVAIENHSRSHNKTVNREARSRLKTLRAARTAMTTLQQRAQELIDSATRINAGSELRERDLTARALLDEQWLTLQEAWQTTVAQVPESAERLAPLPPLNEKLPRTEEIEAAKQAAAAQAAAEQALAAAASEAQAAASDSAAQEVRDADQISSALVRLEERSDTIKTLLDEVNADPGNENADPGAARQQRRQQRSTAAQLLKAINWPTAAQPAELVLALQQAQTTATNAVKDLDAACDAEKARLEQAIVTLTETLAAGQTKAAGTLLGEIRRARPESVAVSKASMAALGRASSQLRQLGSWQQFATSPKRQELCDAMQKAASEPLEPTLQAERIKELRARWQALGPPRDEADRAALKQFDAHAETAFEPCRLHFAALAEQREQNANARQKICEQLEQYLSETDWRSADYDAADSILREARNSWRSFHPVPRKREAQLSKEFEALQEALYQKLQDFWNRNADAKQALIDQAIALGASDSTPLAERIEQAKRLQSEWKRIKRVPHKRDQALWQDFRKACDALFQERDAQASAETQRVDAQRTSAQQTLTNFAATLAETTSETADRATLKAFRGTLREQLATLPGPLQRGMEADAKKLANDYEALLDSAARSATIARLQSFQHWDSAAAESLATLPDDAPAGLFESGDARSEQQWLEQLQRLTVAAEMSADIDSPSADQALRMTLKVERLQQALA
ncbi:MAG: DUF349 domain-containing protein, partial [Pseudomonadales bacterium]